MDSVDFQKLAGKQIFIKLLQKMCVANPFALHFASPIEINGQNPSINARFEIRPSSCKQFKRTVIVSRLCSVGKVFYCNLISDVTLNASLFVYPKTSKCDMRQDSTITANWYSKEMDTDLVIHESVCKSHPDKSTKLSSYCFLVNSI